MDHFLSDQSKFQKTTLTDDDFLNFIINPEKPIDKTKSFLLSAFQTDFINFTNTYLQASKIFSPCFRAVNY